MASPVFFIKKKDGLLQLVQDYQVLNAIIVKNKYPLPLISKLINKLQGAKYFTKLNVHWGFNNVHMKEGDKWKAAFRMNCGLYKFLVMFFGLTNSPATFQTMMDGIPEELITEGIVVVYLDNILIFTKTVEEHQKIVQRVLGVLQTHGLSLKPEKCEFEKTSIEYLGVVISQDTIMMDPAKVTGVSEWPVPTTKKEVQSFLGFVNFDRRFIKGFSHLTRPLFNLTKNNSIFHWSSDEQTTFSALKEKIPFAPILALSNNLKPFWIEADSLDFATRAVLSQQSSKDNKWHPIAVPSKFLSPVEWNYKIHDKEMLAIVRALEEWRHFVEGAEHQVEIWTDHKNLEYFMTTKKLNWRQACWSLPLARFDFINQAKPWVSSMP
jgi:RNase H-like domain found in reverse transcriptase/Reverse transcriptase (RNA-dependent DNA polymerase)